MLPSAGSELFAVQVPAARSSDQELNQLIDAVVPAFLRTYSSEPASLQLVSLFAAVIDSAARDVTLPDTSLVISRLLEIAQSGTTMVSDTSPHRLEVVCTEAALSAARSLASIVNKMHDGAELDALIDMLLSQKLAVVICNSTENFAVRVSALQIYAWIAKALVIRGHKVHAPVCLRFLCNFLTPESQNDDVDVSMEQEASALRKEVAKTFHVLVSEYPDVLNRKCGAFITVRDMLSVDALWLMVN